VKREAEEDFGDVREHEGGQGWGLGPARFVSYGRSANDLRIRRTSLMLALFPLEHELPSDFDRLSALRGDRFAAR
jgi:hypothetical protein